MNFNDLINSNAFFTILIKDDNFFDAIKVKFPDILADLTSSRNNPNCSCKNRVKAYLNSKLESENEFFSNLISNEPIKSLIETNKQEIVNSQTINPMEQHMKMMRENMFKNSGGRIFETGKTEQDWKNLCKTLEDQKFLFKSFSVVEKEDKLIVYFI
jgi:hypothetical protein